MGGYTTAGRSGMVRVCLIAPMLGPVILPPDFLALGKWVIVNGEATNQAQSAVAPWRPIGRVRSATNAPQPKFRSSSRDRTRADTSRLTCKIREFPVGGVAPCRSLSQLAVAPSSNSRSFLPPELRKRTTLVCPKQEAVRLSCLYEDVEIVVQPDPDWTIAKKREWIMREWMRCRLR